MKETKGLDADLMSTMKEVGEGLFGVPYSGAMTQAKKHKPNWACASWPGSWHQSESERGAVPSPPSPAHS